MSSAYDSAKRIALGLEKEADAGFGDDLWNISFDGIGGGIGGGSLAAEMPLQFFEKGFEAPEELVMHRSTLKLYDDEFRSDREAAESNLSRLTDIFRSSDLQALKRMLAALPPVQWLSLIFLDGEKIRTELVPAIEGSGEECKAEFAAALDKALGQLVEFRDLFTALRECCSTAAEKPAE